MGLARFPPAPDRLKAGGQCGVRDVREGRRKAKRVSRTLLPTDQISVKFQIGTMILGPPVSYFSITIIRFEHKSIKKCEPGAAYPASLLVTRSIRPFFFR